MLKYDSTEKINLQGSMENEISREEDCATKNGKKN